MPFIFKRLVLLMSIAAACSGNKAVAADKDKRLTIGPASSYPAKQTNGKITVAASVFESDEQTRPAFGKHNPNQYGILPVLVVIQNDSDQAIRVGELQLEYMTPDGSRIEATPARDIRYLRGARKPNVATGPLPTGPRIGRNKNPLESWEIEGRAFSAKVVPPRESASGFFYFQTGHRPGSKLYVTGMNEAGSGKEILYFEIPLQK